MTLPGDEKDGSPQHSLAHKLGVSVLTDKAPKKKPKRPMHIAVVGATGAVGQELLSVLEQRSFPTASVRCFASERSAGATVVHGGDEIAVQGLAPDSFAGVELAFFAAGSAVTKAWAPKAAEAGAVVIDKSSAFRLDVDVPLVVPEVNGAALAGYTKRRMIATPNCSTIQLVQALAPLARVAGLKRVVVCTYQAVSGAGRGGIVELEQQVRDMFNLREPTAKVFDQRIAFNVLARIPALDPIPADGVTSEERKMVEETRKILGLPSLGLAATCARVPVFHGHSEAVHVELEQPLTPERARALFLDEPNLIVVDNPATGLYPTPQDAAGEDKTLIGRVRQDDSVPDGRGLAFWVVSDNLRTGAALTAVRIAEALCADYLP